VALLTGQFAIAPNNDPEFAQVLCFGFTRDA
jgi:hypothetical protein